MTSFHTVYSRLKREVCASRDWATIVNVEICSEAITNTRGEEKCTEAIVKDGS